MGVNAVQYGIVLTLPWELAHLSANRCWILMSRLRSRVRNPYAIVLVLAVLLIAFVPEITLVLPQLLEGHG